MVEVERPWGLSSWGTVSSVSRPLGAAASGLVSAVVKEGAKPSLPQPVICGKEATLVEGWSGSW